MNNPNLPRAIVIDLANDNEVGNEGHEEPPLAVVVDLANDDNQNNKEIEEPTGAVVVNLVINNVDDQGILEVQEEEPDEAAREEADRQKALSVSAEMTAVSISHYVPGITQIRLVTDEHNTVAEALTVAGDHFTPCERCCLDDADGCFWIMTGIMLNLEGRQVQNRNPTMRNVNICYYLYGSFIDTEYSYMRGPEDRQRRLPRMPLPFCVENDIKHLFPNEDNRPFVGFRSGRRGRERNRREQHLFF